MHDYLNGAGEYACTRRDLKSLRDDLVLLSEESKDRDEKIASAIVHLSSSNAKDFLELSRAVRTIADHVIANNNPSRIVRIVRSSEFRSAIVAFVAAAIGVGCAMVIR